MQSHTMALLLGVVFCVINPIICPSVLVYFLLASVVERYNVSATQATSKYSADMPTQSVYFMQAAF